MDKGEQSDEDLKKLRPTLDLGSHINVRHEPRPKAGAQRTLEGVRLQ
jgi:hypothetical protein